MTFKSLLNRPIFGLYRFPGKTTSFFWPIAAIGPKNGLLLVDPCIRSPVLGPNFPGHRSRKSGLPVGFCARTPQRLALSLPRAVAQISMLKPQALKLSGAYFFAPSGAHARAYLLVHRLDPIAKLVELHRDEIFSFIAILAEHLDLPAVLFGQPIHKRDIAMGCGISEQQPAIATEMFFALFEIPVQEIVLGIEEAFGKHGVNLRAAAVTKRDVKEDDIKSIRRGKRREHIATHSLKFAIDTVKARVFPGI